MMEEYRERFILNEESAERIANINGASNRLKDLSSEYHLPGFLGFTGFGKLFTQGECEVEVIGELGFRKPIMYAFCEIEKGKLSEASSKIYDAFTSDGGLNEGVYAISVNTDSIQRDLEQIGVQVQNNYLIAMQTTEGMRELNIPLEVTSLFHLQIGTGLDKYREQVLTHLKRLGENGTKIWQQIVVNLKRVEYKDEINRFRDQFNGDQETESINLEEILSIPYYPLSVDEAIEYYIINKKA